MEVRKKEGWTFFFSIAFLYWIQSKINTFQDTGDGNGGCTALDATEFSKSISMMKTEAVTSPVSMMTASVEKLEIDSNCKKGIVFLFPAN